MTALNPKGSPTCAMRKVTFLPAAELRLSRTLPLHSSQTPTESCPSMKTTERMGYDAGGEAKRIKAAVSCAPGIWGERISEKRSTRFARRFDGGGKTLVACLRSLGSDERSCRTESQASPVLAAPLVTFFITAPAPTAPA